MTFSLAAAHSLMENPQNPNIRSRSGSDSAPPMCTRDMSEQPLVLASYADEYGAEREILTTPAAAGSTLVIDRDARTHDDRRLVAHLAADEPAQNAALVCRCYIDAARSGRQRCRALTAEDALAAPFPREAHAAGTIERGARGELLDAIGGAYRLEAFARGMSIAQLRWSRASATPTGCDRRLVSLREVIARLESYEPACALTRSAISRRRYDAAVSTTVLCSELTRVQNSPIVLNRGLREAVIAIISREQLSMSEIAIRCGRIKRDARGNESGETSWLARRLGLLSEAGHNRPTPWIHSDVLALIARRGLSISPREVEVT
ncbi:MAG: hypothetical protein QOI03_1295 [Solirubrobacteraceae bacterium]|jgi:hypothetical protein|nr:hypothetical protein [Solirubrobacteraceae bacterium]